jgi:antitoxin (DNA-binding transcriptional repressor) of toxin-antitoxin stability system
MHKEISITDFKARCLEIIREVQEEGASYTITKHRKAVAELHKSGNDDINDTILRNTVIEEGDIISPTSESWDALID